MLMLWRLERNDHEILIGNQEFCESLCPEFLIWSNNILHLEELGVKLLRIFLAWHYSCEGGRESPMRGFSGNFHICCVPSLTRQRDGGGWEQRAGAPSLCLCWRFYRWLNWARAGSAQTSLAGLLAWTRERFWISAQKRTSVRRENMWWPWSPSKMMIIIKIHKLWCKQSDKPRLKTKNFIKELSLSLNNCDSSQISRQDKGVNFKGQ